MKTKYSNKIEYCKSRQEFMTLIEDHGDSFESYDWYLVTKSKFFNISLADNYADKLNWEYLCTFTKLEEKDIEKYADYVNWYEISCFQKLSVPFIKKYKDKLSLNKILTNSKISVNDNSECWKIFRENDDPKHHQIWDENLQNAPLFCPKVFVSKYMDYPGARDDSLLYKTDRYGRLIELTDEEKTARLKERKKKESTKKTSKTKKTEVKSEPVKDETPPVKPEINVKKKTSKKKKPKLDYSTMSKSQLKEVLTERNVKFLYHDTLEILRKKCYESETN